MMRKRGDAMKKVLEGWMVFHVSRDGRDPVAKIVKTQADVWHGRTLDRELEEFDGRMVRLTVEELEDEGA